MSAGRERLPDQLRGLALLGIVLVNMPFLAISNAGLTAEASHSTADRVTSWLIVTFAQGKFYLLFAFLFGYSLTLMLRGRHADGLHRYRRRLVGLAVLGVAHAVLLFVGDILLSYALLGTVLLWFVGRSDRAALIGAGVSMVVALLVLGLMVAAVSVQPTGGFVDDVEAADAALRGSFGEAAAGRAAALPGVLVVLAVLNWAQALAMFLLGMVAGRNGILADPQRHARLWRRLLVLALVVGLPGALLSGWLDLTATGDAEGVVRDVLAVAVGFGTAPALTAGYVALAARATIGRLMTWMAPAGRMSLTGYLGESLLLSAIFCGWGLGWFGRLGPFNGALVALAVWFALEGFAHWWLGRFRYGPAEWLLRAWTYGGLPALRDT